MASTNGLQAVGRTSYFAQLHEEVRRLGGFFNAHLHLDRSGTLARYLSTDTLSALSLQKKHALIADLHSSKEMGTAELTSRVEGLLEQFIASGVTRADTSVDVIPGASDLHSLTTLIDIKNRWSTRIDLRLAAYSPQGFVDAQPERWDLLEQAAQVADYIMSLPERDSRKRYPDHIGFRENCERMLSLAASLGKDVHFHVDQGNHPADSDAETLLSVMENIGRPLGNGATPMVWMVHVISPSAYDEGRFNDLVSRMRDNNVGVIVCPSAALSMRQLTEVRAPTHNSMPRVLEFLNAGIPVRMGSDNIADVTSPAGTPDLMLELFVLAHALRFFDIPILAKISAGINLNDEERQRAGRHLARDRHERQQLIDFFGQTPQ